MSVLHFLRSLPIRRKLTLLLLAPCLTVLLVAGVVLVWFQLATFRHSFERDLTSVAEIMANNATAAIAFKDEAAATEILRALRAKEHIIAAVLVTPDNQAFAHYGNAKAVPGLIASARTPKAEFRANGLLVSRPVMLDGKQIGTLQVLSDYRSVYLPVLHVVLCVLVLVAVVGAAVATLLSSRLQRFVSDPVLRLAATARQVADRGDYSVRAAQENGEEFSVLTRGFNRMLQQIQSQDTALQKASQELSRQVQELQHEISEREKAERKLEEVHKELMTASRQAGMAEVATGVLHNVGNVLNSVNVSANLIGDRLRRPVARGLDKVSAMFSAHREDIGAFLSSDPKGRLIPEYLAKLAALLEEDRAAQLKELQTLVQSIDHIKEIVAMQQSYARLAGITEDLPVVSLLEDALRIHAGAFARHGVTVQRDLHEVPLVRVDKHKVLQILVNLFRNAKYAMDATGRADKTLTVGVGINGSGRVKVIVRDNGVGIAPENLTRIFQHGFTTKADGHGFGLHSGSLAAKEMGGELCAASPGPGQGATFTLELPIADGNQPKHDASN